MGEVKKHKHESWLEHLEHSIEHHLVGTVFFAGLAALFLLSSTVAVRKFGIGAYSERSYKSTARPLHSFELGEGWQSLPYDRLQVTCLAIADATETTRRGFPLYYYREVSELPCGGLPVRSYNPIGFVVDAFIVIGISYAAGALVRHKRKLQTTRKT